MKATFLVKTENILHFLSIVFTGMWLLLVCRFIIMARPGLLDDGYHSAIAHQYLQNGYFKSLLHQLKEVYLGARFYEVHFAFLWLSERLFGTDFGAWYLLQVLMAAVTAVSISSICLRARNSNAWAFFIGASYLTSSAFSESALANFGKAEVEMSLFFCLGILCSLHPRKRTLSVLLLLIGIIAKESGKLLALSLILPYLITYVTQKFSRKRTSGISLPIQGLLLTGLSGLLLVSALSYPASQSTYIRGYFHLDWSLEKILTNLIFYLTQAPDLFVALITALLGYALLLKKSKYFRPKDALGLSLCLTSIAYLALLLTFRFSATYYVYIPSSLAYTSLALLSTNLMGKRLQCMSVVLIAASHLHSIPYNFAVSRSQTLFDTTNFEVMERLARLNFSDREMLWYDVGEESQLVQEWNYLRQTLFDGKTPKSVGCSVTCDRWGFQTDIRNWSSKIELNWRFSTDAQSHLERHEEPFRIGNLLAYRFGDIEVGRYIARAVLPFHETNELSLGGFDQSAIKLVLSVQHENRVFDISRMKNINEVFGWKVYELIASPKFYTRGRDNYGWMRPEAVLISALGSGDQVFEMKLDFPEWIHSFPQVLKLMQNGAVLGTVSVTNPGIYISRFKSSAGTIQLKSDHWVDPEAIGMSPTMGKLSYRLLSVNLVSQ